MAVLNKLISLVVAPLAGARIEIPDRPEVPAAPPVAPLAGARIEITRTHPGRRRRSSLPSRERGLKCDAGHLVIAEDDVAPLAGARIEISEK